MGQGRGVGRVRLGLRVHQGCQHPLQMALARGRRHEITHRIAEHHQAGRVALPPRRKISQRRRNKAHIGEFRDGVRGKPHRTAGIDQQHQLTIGLAMEALDVGAIRTGVDIPVDMSQVIARGVRAIFGELLAEAEIRRAVQTCDEPVDHGCRHQVQPGDGVQHSGVEQILHGCLYGRGICASIWRRMSSASMRSDCAWKFNRIRCRNTGST